MFFTLATLIDLDCIVILNHDFFLHIFGIAVVKNRDGVPAGRLRLLWRNVLAWGFCFLLAPAGFLLWLAVSGLAPVSNGTAFFGILLAVPVLAAVAFALWKPARGLQDWLSGTVLVSR